MRRRDGGGRALCGRVGVAQRRTSQGSTRRAASIQRASPLRASIFARHNPLRPSSVPQRREQRVCAREREDRRELPLLHREHRRARRPRFVLLERRRTVPRHPALRREGRHRARPPHARSRGGVPRDGVRLLPRHLEARRRRMRRHEDLARLREREPPRATRVRPLAAYARAAEGGCRIRQTRPWRRRHASRALCGVGGLLLRLDARAREALHVHRGAEPRICHPHDQEHLPATRLLRPAYDPTAREELPRSLLGAVGAGADRRLDRRRHVTRLPQRSAHLHRLRKRMGVLVLRTESFAKPPPRRHGLRLPRQHIPSASAHRQACRRRGGARRLRDRDASARLGASRG